MKDGIYRYESESRLKPHHPHTLSISLSPYVTFHHPLFPVEWFFFHLFWDDKGLHSHIPSQLARTKATVKNEQQFPSLAFSLTQPRLTRGAKRWITAMFENTFWRFYSVFTLSNVSPLMNAGVQLWRVCQVLWFVGKFVLELCPLEMH